MNNLKKELLKYSYLFSLITIYKNIIVTNETDKSLKKGPVIKNIGINVINIEGKPSNNFLFKFVFLVTYFNLIILIHDGVFHYMLM